MPLVITVKPPLTLPVTVPVTSSPVSRAFEVHPGSQALGLIAGQDCVAISVFEAFDSNGNEIANLNVDFAAVVLEFFDRNEGFV